ncbi:cytochrome-c peroxidase [Pseudoduganella danionis]|uniref:Cytochrome-c peroxidase n=2 Tax=Telluria group TaxID=2895353 RepID=A0A845I280_9BURK|nr:MULTISPECIES: cytochrome c peroxidase [Telluria group]MTW35384.1 cytochrome-c peroxidase [Pseudoduganella danionis]MYN47674.1 cytochrome-c peroxidase [Duganella fentianensis]
MTAVLLALAACSGGSSTSTTSPSTPAPDHTIALSETAKLGELIFKDTSLSASGAQSCASCHDPAAAHAPNNNLAAQFGGANGDVQGFRAAPSLRYLNQTPAFFFAADGTPTGGFDRDGRAASLAEQGERPFLAPHEMANDSKQDVINKLRKTAYVERFRAQFGAGILDDAEQAFGRMTLALQAYQKEAPEFHPFDSKYDLFLAGKVKLSDQELRGLALFNNPAKGNCIACHPSARGADGASPLFTDFTYDNLGVPRNVKLKATANPAYYDLGLCGPDRTDLVDKRSDLCGSFKVPTLRNVATRQAFFHNGAFDNLTSVVSFYVRRDTNPEEWYPLAADGRVQKFNDLPEPYRKNVNVSEVPYNRQPGMAPALSPREIDDVVKFLGTLTDGYKLNP